MKQVTRTLLLSLVPFLLIAQTAEGKGKHYVVRHSGGGGAAGVVLQTPNPETPLEHNNRGVELGSKGLWPDAIREHEIALSMMPANKEFRTNLSSAQLRYGNVLFHAGKIYEAIKQFRGALFVDPDNLPAEESLDECYKKLGKDPLDIKLRRSMAEDFEVKGQIEDAIVEYRKVLKMDDMGRSHADLGRVLIRADKPVDGYQEMRIAVQKVWKNDETNDLAAVHRKLAEILTEYAYKARGRGEGTVGLKRLMNAITEYRRAVTLNPADAQSIGGFVEVVREACALKPCFDNYLMLGGAYLLAHDFAHAKMCYEQCFKFDPRRPELPQARVAYHQAVARWSSASEELVAESVTKVQKFLELDPDNARWWYILGRLKQHQGDSQGAIEAYRRAEKINHLIDPDLEMQIRVLGANPEFPTYGNPMAKQGVAAGVAAGAAAGAPAIAGQPPANAAPIKPAMDPRNMATYVRIEQLMSSDPAQALVLADEVLGKNPADGHAWLLKGMTLKKKGESDPASLDEAAACLRQADAFKEPEATELLAQVNTIRIQPNVGRAQQYMQQSDWVKASNELDDAIVKAPTLPMLHRMKADVMRHLGDNEAAERELKKATDLESKKTAVVPTEKDKTK